MKTSCEWNDKLSFTASVNGFKIIMDGAKPLGNNQAPSPKQYVLSALCTCTGMDVISLLTKYKQVPNDFKVEGEADVEPKHPHELINIRINYVLTGSCEPEKVIEAVELSQTKYCSVSSMLSRGTDIHYNIFLNEKLLASGIADFHKVAHEHHPVDDLNVMTEIF